MAAATIRWELLSFDACPFRARLQRKSGDRLPYAPDQEEEEVLRRIRKRHEALLGYWAQSPDYKRFLVLDSVGTFLPGGVAFETGVSAPLFPNPVDTDIGRKEWEALLAGYRRDVREVCERFF